MEKTKTITAAAMLASLLTAHTYAELAPKIQEKGQDSSIKVYSMLGKEVMSLGKNTTYFEAAKICNQNLPTGRYVINIRAYGTDRASIINVK